MSTQHLLCLTLSLASCAPVTAVVPDGGDRATAAQGVQLTLLDEPWRGEPHDLPAYLLPVAVEIRNGGTATLDVNLGDFVVTDEGGLQVHACLLADVLVEDAPGAAPLRGPLLAVVGPPPQAAPDEGPALRGSTAPAPVSDALRLALPQGHLPPGRAVRGFLYFHVEEPSRPRPLRLRWRAHQSASATVVAEIELRLRLQQRP